MGHYSKLDDTTVKLIGIENLRDLAVKALSDVHRVLLVCDVWYDKESEEFKSYIDALVKADIINEEQKQKVISHDLQIVVMPFNTIEIAIDVYRHISHASHFVSIWVDGKQYDSSC